MGGRTARRRDAEMMHLLDNTFAQINQNPNLVARAEVPWQSVAQNTQASPAIAGFQIASAGIMPRANGQGQTASLHPGAAGDPDDEDAAESRIDPDDVPSVVTQSATAAPSQSRPAAVVQPPPPVAATRTAMLLPPPPVRVVSLPHEDAQKDTQTAKADAHAPRPIPRPQMPVVLAAYHPQPTLALVPHARPAVIGEGAASMGVSHSIQSAQNIQSWTIQIGAFADETSAKAQLSAYAERSMDVLGQASRIVVPFQGVDGHTLYRARFGPFAEREAREVCERLTERGQTCFAAVAAR
jgi:D-alanyl-D-alanine carboxypeptidase